jgi:hypothetical protein
MVVVTGQINLRGVLGGAIAEKQVSSLSPGLPSFFDQRLVQDHYRQRASQLGNVTIGIGDRARPLDLVGDEHRMNHMRRCCPGWDRDAELGVDLVVSDWNFLILFILGLRSR